MFGFVVGTACLVGLVVVVARGRHRHRYWGPPGGALYAALARLETTPGQEKAIRAALDELFEVARGARGALRQTREAAARAVGGSSFDESSLRQAFAVQDTTLAELREAFVAAGRKIHDVLDDGQRKRLAGLIESAHGFGPFGFHHHRHHHAC